MFFKTIDGVNYTLKTVEEFEHVINFDLLN